MSNIFNGVPHNHQASGVFPSDPTISYFFYYDGTINKVYKHDSTSNTTTIHDIGTGANQLFPNIPTNQAMDRATWSSNGNVYVKWEDSPGVYRQRGFTSPTTSPLGATYTTSDKLHDATTPNTSYAIGISPTQMLVRLPNNGWATDHQYNQGSWGGANTPYNGLPQTGHRSMNMIIGFNAMVNVFYDTGIVYTIDLSNQTVVSSAPYGASSGSLLGASVVNIFNGVPWDHSASVSFDNDPTISYFFRMNPATNLNQVFIHDETTNTTTVSDIGIPTMFPDLPTNIPITHGSENQPQNIGEHLIYWLDNTLSPPLQFIVTTSPTAVPVFIGSGNNNYVYHTGASVEQVSTGAQWYAVLGWNFFYAARGSISHYLPTGNYGGVGQPYAGLPYIAGGPQVETEYCSILRVLGQENQVYLFRPNGDVIILDLLAQQISSTVQYGPIAPTAPPTPLPDILVEYNAPGDFAYFASDVSLVTENQYGWNFTKTLNDSNKMELYLYFLQPGNPIFYYNELLELTVNMKNNLVMGTGNLFFNVYTVGTAGGWYGTKTTYFGNPDLGTTLDLDLLERTINISDSRTDQILAISIGTNSAQQQVNLDVENVSFNVLVPATNNTQRVKVKLQNTFIVLDDKYWDLDQTAEGYINTSLIQGYSINNWSPNIVAGNYPQSGTAEDAPHGTALYLAGTWQYWETLDGTTWTPTPNSTLTWGPQVSSVVPPSIQSNGYAYIGTTGLTDNRDPVGFPASYGPLIWTVSNTNQLSVQWVGYRPASYTPLSLMTTPNNFTAAQKASGLFDASGAVGGTDIGVWISTATPPNGDPVADRNIVFNVLSETQLTIKRSWELSTTTYTGSLTSGRSITGQYSDPSYSTPSVCPNNFVMPRNWIVDADNSFRFEILFSGGLNNSIPAVNQNARQMTVTPTPSTAVTFSWVANYYTAGNILIGPVAGIGTTGLVSSFTTGGSLKPANAAYILYGCTSSENVDAFTSIVFIEPEPITLQFSGGNSNNISVGGNYNVTALPNDSQSTYTFTARFYSKQDVDLGLVPGATTTVNQSSFTIDYATLPANVGYIYYTCKAFGGGPQDQSEAALTINIEQPCPESFVLLSNIIGNQVSTDGTYFVYPDPISQLAGYSYTAFFFDSSGTNLGAVPNIGLTGQSSPFTITYATLPVGTTYLEYTCNATGGTQDGESASLTITIIPEVIPPEPGTTTVSAFNNSNSFINHINYNILESHKKMNHRNLTELELKLLDENNKVAFSSTPIYYELEIKYNGSIF